MDRYAVVGNPIAHSLSPAIHAAFAKATAHAIEYTRVMLPLEHFAVSVDRLRREGYRGLNVTIPFKRDAYAYATLRSGRARLAGAANTLVFDSSAVQADNTDGVGLINDLVKNHGVALVGRRVLILGAGGSVRGVLGPVLDQGAASVALANRTLASAQELAQAFSAQGRVEALPLTAPGGSYDVVINSIPAGVATQLPALPKGLFAPSGFAYDLVYARDATPFVDWARRHGARVSDGLGMLVEQAAESFFVWRGVRPDTAPVIAAMRKELS